MASGSGGDDGKKKRRKQVTMEVVDAEQGKALPILAYFPTAFDPCGASKQHKEDDQLDHQPVTELYRNSEKFKTGQYQLVVRTHDNVDFVGTGETGWQPAVYAMGVFDKDEGTLKVVPIVSNKVVRMEPRIRGVAYKIDDGELGDADLDNEAKFQKRKDLVNRFGTKKSKTGLQRYSRSAVTETSLKGTVEEFKGTLQAATEKEGLVQTRQSVIDAANQAMERKIPPYNLEATTLDDAYPLDKIISAEEWEVLDVDLLLKAAKSPIQLDKLRQTNSYPKFVLDRLPRLTTAGDREGVKKRARMLAYLRHLLTLYHATIGRIFRGSDPDFNESAVHDVPEVVYNKLQALFVRDKLQEKTQNNRRSTKSLQRNYLLSYILVLGLKVDGHEVDPYDVAVELKTTVTDLEPHYMQLGCKIEGSREAAQAGRSKSKASLVLPLKLVDLSEERKGRKRGRGR